MDNDLNCHFCNTDVKSFFIKETDPLSDFQGHYKCECKRTTLFSNNIISFHYLNYYIVCNTNSNNSLILLTNYKVININFEYKEGLKTLKKIIINKIIL